MPFVLPRAGAAVASLLIGLSTVPVFASAAEADAAPSPTTTATGAVTATPSATAAASATPAASAAATATATTTGTAPTASPSATETSPGAPTGTATAHLSPPAVTGATGQQAQDAGAFIAATLAAGGHHYVYPGTTYLDGGNTVDAILALDGAGVGRSEAGAATAYLVAHLGDYVGSGGETYAGPTAKALLAVLAQGLDPHDVGGTDLVATLAGLETPSGRFSDVSAYGDYSNTIGQALAIIALARAGAPVSAAAVTFLRDQACSDGGFRIDPSAEGCASDPDATAFAVQALLAVGAPTLDTSSPASAGLDFLVGIQGPDGGLPSATGPMNANTTGVAAQAFAAGGRAAALAEAQGFLAGLQYGCSFPAGLRGGIAFTTADRAGSSATAPQDSDLRATPQAALGLAGGTLASVTADGAAAGTTAMVCAAPTTSTGSSSSTSTDASAPATSASAGADAASGELAYTGASVAEPVGLGLALLGSGIVALAMGSLIRRRGVHT